MEKKHTGSMAFPFVLPPNDEPYEIDGFAINAGRLAVSVGMTLRDYFAAKAMLMHGAAMSGVATSGPEEWDALVTERAYWTADAMLRAREAV